MTQCHDTMGFIWRNQTCDLCSTNISQSAQIYCSHMLHCVCWDYQRLAVTTDTPRHSQTSQMAHYFYTVYLHYHQ